MTQYQTEKDFSEAVVDYARSQGWEVWRTWYSAHSPPGEPDLRMVRPPRVVFAELKTMKGKLSEHQKRARDLLEECGGVEYFLWRPDDWSSIEDILERKVGRTHTANLSGGLDARH